MRLKAAAKGLSNFKIKICTGRGGSRIFSRGGGGADFQKKFENFDGLFFRSTKSIFQSSKKTFLAPFGKF